MNDKETAKAKRQGYEVGCYNNSAQSTQGCKDLAKIAYPMPRVPREVMVDNYRYRVIDGKLEYQYKDSSNWHQFIDAKAALILKDLLNNPTEEVSE